MQWEGVCEKSFLLTSVHDIYESLLLLVTVFSKYLTENWK